MVQDKKRAYSAAVVITPKAKMRVAGLASSHRAADDAFIYSSSSPKAVKKTRSKTAIREDEEKGVAEFARSIVVPASQSNSEGPDAEDAFTQRSKHRVADHGAGNGEASSEQSSEEESEHGADDEDVMSMLVRELHHMQQERIAKKCNRQMGLAESAATAQVVAYLDQWVLDCSKQTAPVDKLTALVADADVICKRVDAALKLTADEEAAVVQEMIGLDAQTRRCLETSESMEKEIKAEIKALEGSVQRRKKQCIETFRARGDGPSVKAKTVEKTKTKTKGGALPADAWDQV